MLREAIGQRLCRLPTLAPDFSREPWQRPRYRNTRNTHHLQFAMGFVTTSRVATRVPNENAAHPEGRGAEGRKARSGLEKQPRAASSSRQAPRLSPTQPLGPGCLDGNTEAGRGGRTRGARHAARIFRTRESVSPGRARGPRQAHPPYRRSSPLILQVRALVPGRSRSAGCGSLVAVLAAEHAACSQCLPSGRRTIQSALSSMAG